MNYSLILACLLLSGGTCLLSLILTPIARRLALRSRFVDAPGTRKIHIDDKPYGGGVAMYLSIALVLLASYAILAFGQFFFWEDLRAQIDMHLAGIMDPRTQRKFLSICLGATLVFVIGVIDDYRGISPKLKLLAQLMAGGVLVWGGVRATVFIESELVSVIVTIGWVVFLTNGFNLLDNMDGLSAGVAAVAGILFWVIAVQSGQIFIAAFLSIFVGAILGFLRYNIAPARLFMGDAGSYLLGFLLSSMTIAATFYTADNDIYHICMPLMVLGVPIFDTLSVIVIRVRSGKSIFLGDKNHLSHRLVRLGFSRRGAVFVIYLLGLLLGGLAVLLRQLDEAGAVLCLGLGVGVAVLMALLMWAATHRSEESDRM